jgi:pimeloyl-ACP methyl ester carboxylesterase
MTQAADKNAIRPFRVNVPEAELTELRRRINATRWPERETVGDASQGVQLATTQQLARYWATEYDWRKCEAKLNALPNFITEIDGLDIHFIHVRSKHDNALPLIVTHGWPGSIVEQLKIVDPLTNPTAHGASASDAFHLVIPSMPGYGFSGKPTTPGWDPPHIARAWVVLMKRLGYTKFVAQGGDWGAMVTDVMGTQAPPAFTSTGLSRFHQTSIRRSKPVTRCHPIFQPTNDARASSWPSSTGAEWATPWRWRTARRRSTEWRIRLLALPRGSSTTTRAVTRSSRASSTVSVRGSRETTSSTTSRSTG